MADIAVRVRGVRQLRDALDDLAIDLSADGLADESETVGQLVAGEARRRAPRKTGHLALTIHGDKTGIVATAAYAPPVHWGVPERGIEPHEFLTDAVEATDHAWVAVYEHAARDAAAKAERRSHH